MDYIKYDIKEGSTLESIAKEKGISVKELLDFHNSKASMTQQIYGDHIPLHVVSINIPSQKIAKVDFESAKIEEGTSTRYRCEQVNTSKFSGNIVHYFNQKFQYLLKQNLEYRIAQVKLEDYSQESTTNTINDVFCFIAETEKIKNNVKFSLDKFGKIDSIANKIELEKDWLKFKKNKFYEMPFIISLQKENPNAVEELLQMGDQQFAKNAANEEEYWRNFFYFSCFDQYLYKKDNFHTIDFDFISTILPPIIIPLQIRYDKVSENNKILTVRKVAESVISESLYKDIIERYNQLHKKVIKFEFTQYKLIFRSTIEIDLNEGVVLGGTVNLKEEISDNVENQCNYSFKKLENYIPN